MPWPTKPGLFEYQLELHGGPRHLKGNQEKEVHTSQKRKAVITCAAQFLPETAAPNEGANVALPSELPLAWTGVLAVTLEKVTVKSSVFGFTYDLIDVAAKVQVPSCHLFTEDGISVNKDTFDATTLKHVELRKPL